jgi:N-acetylmuramic acid 6-phosphate (MurNAc-6-P) etherase
VVQHFPVPADGVTQYTIGGLEAEQKYGVWVVAVSLTTDSQGSEVIIGIPKNDGKIHVYLGVLCVD